jgi:hypothetical protein
MDQETNTITIARNLIKRYGYQAEAMAEERAAILSQQDPGLAHLWRQIPTVISELRRSNAAHERQATKRDN